MYIYNVRVWFEILSELFVNFAAAWFAVVFIETQITDIRTIEEILQLTLRFILGILSLFIAKYLREKGRKK